MENKETLKNEKQTMERENSVTKRKYLADSPTHQAKIFGRSPTHQAKIFGRQSYTLGENKKAIDKPIRPLDILDFIKREQQVQIRNNETVILTGSNIEDSPSWCQKRVRSRPNLKSRWGLSLLVPVKDSEQSQPEIYKSKISSLTFIAEKICILIF